MSDAKSRRQGTLTAAIRGDRTGGHADAYRAVLLTRACSELLDKLRDGAPFEVVGQVAAKWAQTVVGAQGASATRVRGEMLEYAAATGSVSGIVGRQVYLDDSFTGRVLREGKTRIFDPAMAGSGSKERASKDRVASGIVAPIIVDGEAVGTLGVVSTTALRFDDADVATVEALAEFLALQLPRTGDAAVTYRKALRDILSTAQDGGDDPAYTLALVEARARDALDGTDGQKPQ